MRAADADQSRSERLRGRALSVSQRLDGRIDKIDWESPLRTLRSYATGYDCNFFFIQFKMK